MKKNSVILVVSLCVVVSFLAVMPGVAQVPKKLNYQGYLTDAGGTPVTGNVAMMFAIYDVATGGSPLWTEPQTVSVDDGYYSVQLGAVTPVTLTEAKPYYLGVTVGSDPEMTPREELTSVLYALFVGNLPQGSTKPDPPCFDNINRYVDCGNGTVTDTTTGRIWLKNANCFAQLTYTDANDAAAGLEHGDCGLTDNSTPGDWWLPTEREWNRMIARAVALQCTIELFEDPPSLTNTPGTGCYSAGPQPFTNVQLASYWSSTAREGDPADAYYVLLDHGDILYQFKTYTHYVWPVRGGQW